MLALCCARRFWLALNNGFRKYYWLVQKYLWDRSKVEHNKKKTKSCCVPAWLVLVHVQRALVGWLSLLQSQCFCTFIFLCCRGQKPTIIRFNGENVRKWTLIHCSRRCMCDCSFFIVVVVVCIVLCVYMSCLHLVWWCRFSKLQFCSLQFRLYAVRVQHKVSNWTNALIYCDPFWIVSWVFNRYRYSANLFGVKIFFSSSPLYLSLRSIGSFVRFYFCFAFWITFEKKGIKKCVKCLIIWTIALDYHRWWLCDLVGDSVSKPLF